MSESEWYFGYRCEVRESCIYPDKWVGMVFVPRSHPVCREGFCECGVLSLTPMEWIVCLDESYNSPRGMLFSTVAVAYQLKVMQREWDQLSPYEREYRIW